MDNDDLEFLMNTYDPTREDAESQFRHINTPLKSMGEQWEDHLKWLDEHVIGDPKPNQYYSVYQLKSMGMVGVYRVRETNDVDTEVLELPDEIKN